MAGTLSFQNTRLGQKWPGNSLQGKITKMALIFSHFTSTNSLRDTGTAEGGRFYASLLHKRSERRNAETVHGPGPNGIFETVSC